MSLLLDLYNSFRRNFFAPTIKDIDLKYQSFVGFLSSITQSISSIQYGERHSGGYAARYEIERLLAIPCSLDNPKIIG